MDAEPITWTTTHGDTVTVFHRDRAVRIEMHSFGHEAIERRWYWNVRAANGRKVGAGGEGYNRRRNAVRAALRHHPRLEASDA